VKNLVAALTACLLVAALGWVARLQWRPASAPSLPLSPLPGDEAIAPAASEAAPGDVPIPPAAMPASDSALPGPPDALLKPSVRHPIEAPAAALPLPPLADSDAEIIAALSEVMDASLLRRYFELETLARRFVVCVDLLPSGKLPLQARLAHRVEGRFAVTEHGDGSTLDPSNEARYAPLLQFLTTQDTATLARVYRRFHPLLQQAYGEIGYPELYFNDRLVAVIDHLLAVQAPVEPIALVQPKVFYTYADPALESASAGHRILYRLGPAHRARVLQWLGRLRAELAGLPPADNDSRPPPTGAAH
jgi:hypothetical protein